MKFDAKWYFDYVSPFSFLQFQKFKNLNRELNLEYKPVLLAGLLKKWEDKGPAEIEPNREFVHRFVIWLASELGVELIFPKKHPFNPLPFLRLTIALGNDKLVVDKIFKSIWQSGEDVSGHEFWVKLYKDLGVSDADSKINQEGVKSKLVSHGLEAEKLRVFGVPTLVVREVPFWGLDATDFALDFLDNPTLLDQEQYQKAANVEFGVKRT